MVSKVEYINPEGTCPAQGLYSHLALVTSGSLAYIAGQLSVSNDGEIVGSHDLAAQFRQVFSNLAAVINGIGASHADIVKFTTYLIDSSDIDQFMTLRADYFPTIFKGPLFPPNTLIIVQRLVKPEFRIEVEAIVTVGS